MPDPPAVDPVEAFADRAQWESWLADHHESTTGVWLKIAKKGSGKTSVTITAALDVALCYGWIDSQRKTYDRDYYLQKYSPRRPNSPWSRINVEKVKALIAAGRMRDSGLAAIRAAQADGRWDAASQVQGDATVARATQYLALLRGINVGGKNIIKMADLKACLEAAGFVGVATYIQSGNVLLTSPDSARRLTERLEGLLSEEFAYRSRLVVRSQAQLRRTVTHAPAGFGDEPSTYRCDVLFLKEPLTSAQAMREVMVREGVDAAYPGPGVIYFSRLEQRATQSRLSRLASLPVYQYMTVRNWNTTTKLLALMDARRP